MLVGSNQVGQPADRGRLAVLVQAESLRRLRGATRERAGEVALARGNAQERFAGTDSIAGHLDLKTAIRQCFARPAQRSPPVTCTLNARESNRICHERSLTKERLRYSRSGSLR